MQAAARQGALLASCMGFCAMHQLHLSLQAPSVASIAAEEMALSTVCSILARREVLLLQRGAFVRMALGRFSHALANLKSLATGNISETALIVVEEKAAHLTHCSVLHVSTDLSSNPLCAVLSIPVPPEQKCLGGSYLKERGC